MADDGCAGCIGCGCLAALAVPLLCVSLICAPFVLCGCQRITEREYYEPTEQTMHVGKDGLIRGAVKREAGKNGVPDPSNNKTFQLNVLNL